VDIHGVNHTKWPKECRNCDKYFNVYKICCKDLAVTAKELRAKFNDYIIDEYIMGIFKRKEEQDTCDDFSFKPAILRTINEEKKQYILYPESISWEEDYI
jgi:hypothetical protein